MSRSRLIVGVALMTLGAVFLLDRLEIANAGSLLARWWPLIIVGLGAARAFDRPPDRLGGGVTAGFGLILLAMTQGALTAPLLAYAAPLGLIGLGLWIMVGHRPQRTDAHVDTVEALTVFSGRKLAPASTRFTGGSLATVFGGIDIDLRHARPAAAGARLDVTAIFGGVDVVVPPGWRVQMHGPAIFGGYSNHAEEQVLPEDAPQLDVRVLALFGGVDVKLRAPVPV